MRASDPLKSKRLAISLLAVSTAFLSSTALGAHMMSNEGMVCLLFLVGLVAEQRHAAAGAEKAGVGIDAQLVARVDDVEVAHRELPDAIGGREEYLALLHGEAFGLVGEVRALRVEDRVVVAAAQPEYHLARDGARHPALRGLAQHQCLRI